MPYSWKYNSTDKSFQVYRQIFIAFCLRPLFMNLDSEILGQISKNRLFDEQIAANKVLIIMKTVVCEHQFRTKCWLGPIYSNFFEPGQAWAFYLISSRPVRAFFETKLLAGPSIGRKPKNCFAGLSLKSA